MSNSKPKGPLPGAGDVSSRHMIFTMGGIGLACGILIVFTFQMTYPIIKKNKAEALERAVFEVMPGAEKKSAFTLSGGTLVPAPETEDDAVRYYACYDGDQKLIGVAIEAHGQGFQDVLRVLYGYSTESGNIVGLKVLESRETPGLGDKIEKDPDFRANFDALSVELNEEGNEIVNPIILVKHGQKTESWQIESITGATISSRAIATILRKSTEETIPVIVGNRDVLAGGAP